MASRVVVLFFWYKVAINVLVINRVTLNKSMPNETEQFINDNPMEQSFVPETVEGNEPKNERTEDEEYDFTELKNRREKRLMDKLQQERESNIELNARLKTISEARSLSEESADYLKNVTRLYGQDSPEAIAATELLTNALKGLEERAVQRAAETIREEQRAARESAQRAEKELDSFIEDIEDTHNVVFTEKMQKDYFALMHKLSPKDSEGNVTAYADPETVWEIYKERSKPKTDNRQKDMASRAMSAGGNQSDQKVQDEAVRSFLKQAGII